MGLVSAFLSIVESSINKNIYLKFMKVKLHKNLRVIWVKGTLFAPLDCSEFERKINHN